MVKITRPIKKNSYLRHRLFSQLDSMSDKPVIWISAPGGSGKTTLITSYLETRKSSSLWYQCDQGDNDPATFFYYMGLAAAKTASGKSNPLPLFAPEYQQSMFTFTRNYFGQLYKQLKKESVIVFDNYQDIGDDASFAGILNTAFSCLQDGIRFIVISRQDPPEHFIRLLANSEMGMLYWPDIRLTEEEVGEMVHIRAKEPVSEEFIHNLYRISDGWAAGVVLLMTSTRKSSATPSSLMERHSNEEIMTYFSQEIFNHLDPKTQDFLMRSAFLPKMTVKMAIELTGYESAAEILESMNRKNYFISKHGSKDPLFEYHPLYRDFLLHRTQTELPAGIRRATQHSAAMLLDREGQTEAAVNLLFDINEWESLILIILIRAPEIVFIQSRHHVLQKWIENMPESLRNNNGWLLCWRGLCEVLFDAHHSLPFFEKAYQAFDREGDAIGAMLAASGVLMAIVLSFDDFARLDEWFLELHDRASKVETFPNKELEGYIITSLIMALVYREIDHPAAEKWISSLLGYETTPETINAKIHVLFCIAWRHLIRADLRSSAQTSSAVKQLVPVFKHQPASMVAAKIAEMLHGLVSVNHSQTMLAAQEGLDIANTMGVHMHDTWLYSLAAISCLDVMDIKEGQSWLASVEPVAHSWPSWSQAAYHLQCTRMALLQNELQRAYYHGQLACDCSEKSGGPFSLAAARIAYAVVLHKLKRKEEAGEYLALSRSYAVHKAVLTVSATALLTEAYFCFEEGKEKDALEHLRQALSLARESGYAFTYMDDPSVTVKMCERALEAGIEEDYVHEIIRRRNFTADTSPMHFKSWPWRIRVYTLGSFQLMIDGKPITFPRKTQQKPLVMLKAIIALGGKDVREEQICDSLWPDADGDLAHQSFKTALHRLRKILESPEAVQFKEGKLSLDDRLCWVDAWAFESLLDRSESRRSQGHSEQACELVSRAIKLYPGGFLSDESEDGWAVHLSKRLQGRYIKAVLWMLKYLEECSRWEEAAACCEQSIELYPCAEDLYRRLMVYYSKLGQKGNVSSVYDRLTRALKTELDDKPTSETEALLANILSL